jgi:hypothetical protein
VVTAKIFFLKGLWAGMDAALFPLYFKDSGVEGTNAHLGFAGLERGFVDFAVDMS